MVPTMQGNKIDFNWKYHFSKLYWQGESELYAYCFADILRIQEKCPFFSSGPMAMYAQS